MSLLVVGSFALDSIETPAGHRDQVLGGSASYMATAASFFCPVSVAGVVGHDFPQAHLAFLAERGIDVAAVAQGEGRTFRWRGFYGHDLNEAHTLATELNIFATWRPCLLEAQRDHRWVMLGNFGPGAQATVLDQLRPAPQNGQAPSAAGAAFVGCDTMNYWIAGHTRELKSTLARVHMLCVNEAEARQLTGEQNLLRAARGILQMGPSRLVIKRGEYGAMLFDGDQIFTLPAYPLEQVVDPTGAGDSFAGGMMGYLARHAGAGALDAACLRQAMVVGSTMASFVIEDFSLDRMRRLSRQDLNQRLQRYQRMLEVKIVDVSS